MREPKSTKRNPPQELVLLGQAGINPQEIREHVEKLCGFQPRDEELKWTEILRFLVEEALAGRVPLARDVARKVWKEEMDRGDSKIRGVMMKLRNLLEEHAYDRPNEIQLVIPEGVYYILTPRRTISRTETRLPRSDEVPQAQIVEPTNCSEVNQRVTVRGRIDAVDPDLQLWLVVETPVGDHYPQCRVSRASTEFEHEVRIGRVQFGSDEGAEYVIQLVAAAADGDAGFFQYLRANRDGFGPVLPTDSRILDSKRVTRRDLRS